MFQQLLLPIMTFLAGGFIGVVIGWFLRGFSKDFTKEAKLGWERSMVTIFVTLVWAVSAVLDVVLDTYETPVAVHGVMGMVVGFFFEKRFLERKK